MPSAGEDVIRLDISRLPIGAWYYQVNQSGSPSFGKFQKMK
jgi:hypothetical protein